MEALILVVIIAWASRHAWNDTKAGAAKSRKAYMERAAKKYPGMSKRQASRHAWRHDAGHALSQLLRGFPGARHGFAAGWHEGRQAHAEARAGRERAKAEHLETRARLLPEMRDYLRRQREAQDELRGRGEGTGGIPEGSSPGDPAPHDYCPYCSTRDDQPCPPRCASWTLGGGPYPGREAGPSYSYGPEGDTAGWPSATAEHAHAKAEYMSGDGDSWVVTEYPPGGGRGRTAATYRGGALVGGAGPEHPGECSHGPAACRAPLTCPCSCAACAAAYSAWIGRMAEIRKTALGGPPSAGPPVSDRQQERDADPRLRNACSACGHDGTGDDPLVLTGGGSRVHRSHTLDPDSGFYEDVGARPSRRVDGRPETDADRRFFELRESGYDGPVDRDGNIPGCWLCGLPVGGDELGASAHQRCLDVNERDLQGSEVTDDRDLEEVELDLRGRGKCPYQVKARGHDGGAIYCGQPADGKFCPQHEAEAKGDWDGARTVIHRHTRELLANATTSTEGTTMASDVTFDGVVRDMQAAVSDAETRSAEVNAAMVTAEQQAHDTASAKTRASHTADAMQALDLDPSTLGAMADHIDALDEAERAHQHVLEAYEAARKAAVRVMETAQTVSATLGQEQGQLAEAHKNTNHAADKEFFEEG